MLAVYGAGTLDALFATRSDRFAVMSRQLRHVMKILYGVPFAEDGQGELSEGRSLTRSVLNKLGIKPWF